MTNTTKQPTADDLKLTAQKARLEAEKAWYAYACECELGHEREYSFEVYERIRTATRRFP